MYVQPSQANHQGYTLDTTYNPYTQNGHSIVDVNNYQSNVPPYHQQQFSTLSYPTHGAYQPAYHGPIYATNMWPQQQQQQPDLSAQMSQLSIMNHNNNSQMPLQQQQQEYQIPFYGVTNDVDDQMIQAAILSSLQENYQSENANVLDQQQQPEASPQQEQQQPVQQFHEQEQQYQQQLPELESMGFYDRQRNLQYLILFHGDLTQVTSCLLSEMD